MPVFTIDGSGTRARGARGGLAGSVFTIDGPPLTDPFQALVRQINAMRPLSATQARALVDAGLTAISAAQRSDGRQAASRSEIEAKLRWHEAQAAARIAIPLGAYPYADDLKQWVIRAIIEQNTAAVGRAAQVRAAMVFFSDTAENFRALPSATVALAKQGYTAITEPFVERVAAKVPLWPVLAIAGLGVTIALVAVGRRSMRSAPVRALGAPRPRLPSSQRAFSISGAWL